METPKIIKSIFVWIFLCCLLKCSSALDLDYVEDMDVDDESRSLFPIVIGPGGTVTFNLTQLATYGAFFATALLSGLAFGALGFLLFGLFKHKYDGSGYYGSGGYEQDGAYSSYSSYRYVD